MSVERDPVLDWVRRLNDLARKLDEDAASLHPSAWSEALGAEMAEWKRLAKAGPKDNGGEPHA